MTFFKKHPKVTIALLFTTALLALGGSVVFYYGSKIIKDSPKITEKQLKSESTWNIYDKNNKIIASQTDVKQSYIKYDKIPKQYINFLINTENNTYFTDPGWSLKHTIIAGMSLIRAKLPTWIGGGGSIRGGSSIEQQLIKNVAYSTNIKDRTINRKIQELWLANQITKNWSKEQVLEWYINKINMGEGSYGADTISYTYFGKHLNEYNEKDPADLSKLALIAGLGQAPSTYNLYDNQKAVERRRNTVLKRAYDEKTITKKQYQAIKKIPIKSGLKERYWSTIQNNTNVSKHNGYITSVLRQVKELGYDLEKTPIQIHTHLDPSQDNKLQQIVADKKYYKNDNQQIAVTVIDPKTGNVIAQSGSRYQAQEDPYALNRATSRGRSTGSSIKPFIDYGPAIESHGLGTNYSLDSSPYTYPGTSIQATNYGGYTYGIVDMKKALGLSLNTPAIRLLDQVNGSNTTKKFLRKLNIDVKESYGGADALGLNLSTEDMAESFAAIASNGIHKEANYIKNLEFSDGSIKEIKSTEQRAMKESTAFILERMLEGTMQDNYSASSARIPEYKGYFVKTGTVGYDMTDGIPRPDRSASDSWMNGGTKSVVASVWTGYDSPNKPGNWIEENQSTRSDIFVAIMKAFNQGEDTSAFNKPNTVQQSGSGYTADYIPLDVKPEIKYYSPSINNTNTEAEKYDVDDPKVNAKNNYNIPKDFKINAWNKDLKDKNLDLFNKWKNNTPYPTINDIIDDKTFKSE